MLLDRYKLKMYQSSLKMILYVAVRELFKCDVYYVHSLDKGLYCQIKSNKKLTNDDITLLKNKMQEIINSNDKIIRKVVTKKDAYKYYLKVKEYEKADNVSNLNNKTVTLYELRGYYNYFMDALLENVSDIKSYDITYLGNNSLILAYPITDDGIVPKYTSQNMILNSFTFYGNWCKKQNVNYVCDLNKLVSESKIKDFIKKNDIAMDNQIFQMALVIKKENRKLVLLGGPSSSGKTTSTRKLVLYLSTIGIKTISLSLDDYFKDRELTPKDSSGEYDFESLDALELDLFNNQLKDILDKKRVNIPTFNFITGKKEFNDNFIELKDNEILLIEGLHCLNPELTSNIEPNKKLKIYISPFMPLSIDRHNHISTVDLRLLRRIVRDNRTRGNNALRTLELWDKVRDGEANYIFPFTHEANLVLNTSYIYEIGVLKVYVEPLLYSVPIESDYYKESRRLINELQMFFPIPSEYISDDNILREFIGESYFE